MQSPGPQATFGFLSLSGCNRANGVALFLPLFRLPSRMLLLWSLLAHRLPGRRKTMIDDYRMAASVAAAAGETADYRLNFRRMLEMSGGGPQLRFEFAATLYQLGEKDEALP